MKQSLLIAVLVSLGITSPLLVAEAQEAPLPKASYRLVPDFFKLPPGANFGEAAGVAVNSKGHIFVSHRGSRPLMEFDAQGNFVRSLADNLFTTPHGLRIGAQDNLWTSP